MSRFPLFAFVLFVLCSITKGQLLCYSCVSQGGADDACITNPAAVTANTPIVKCKSSKDYCSIRRLEYASDPGTIFSFLRGCDPDPLPEGENPGEDIVVWARSCKFADLCNVGNGLDEITPESMAGGGDNPNVIIVPASASSLTIEKIPFIITILLVALFRNHLYRFENSLLP